MYMSIVMKAWILNTIFALIYCQEVEFYPNSAFFDVLRSGTNGEDMEPESNKTAVEGSEVIIPCTMDNTKAIAVVWMDKFQNVLFYNDHRIIDDRRFEMIHQGSTWNLRISPVTPRDSGRYKCVANTIPIKYKLYDLTVYEPAKIDRAASSADVIADEGNDVYLICNATGFPEPKITWTEHRAHDRPIKIQEIPNSGKVLTIHDIARHCDNIYTCRAFNGFGSADAHNIRVQVRFKPLVELPNSKLSQYLGKSVVLTCVIHAYPLSKTYWAKDSIQITEYEGKFKYDYIDEVNGWKRVMTLLIADITVNDYGSYKCVALNALGRDQQYMQLDGMEKEADPESTIPAVQSIGSDGDEKYHNGERTKVVSEENSENTFPNINTPFTVDTEIKPIRTPQKVLEVSVSTTPAKPAVRRTALKSKPTPRPSNNSASASSWSYMLAAFAILWKNLVP